MGQGGPPRVAAPGITSDGGKRSVLLWHNGPHHRSAAVGRRDAAQPTTQGRSLLLLLELVLVLVVYGEGRSGGASVGVGVVGCRCRLVVHQAVEGSLLLLLLLLVVLKVAGWIELLHVLLRMMRLLWMVIHLLLLVLLRQFHFNAAATRGLMVVMHRMVIRRRPSDLLTATE